MKEDFNTEESEPCLSQFLFEINAKNIVKEPTCCKSLSKPICTDLVVTNSSSSFQNTKTLSMGLSDFYKMLITFLNNTPKELLYRDCKNTDMLTFKRERGEKLNQQIN